MFGLGKNNILVNVKVAGFFAVMLSLSAVSSETYALNLAPDCSNAIATPNLIIPPDNRMVPIQITGVVDPESLPVTIEAQCIMQDEPVEYWRWYNIFKDDDEKDDDDMPLGRYDAAGLTTSTPSIRARTRDEYYLWSEFKEIESEGRVYDVIFKATDSDGAMCSGKVAVKVPEEEDDGEAPEPVIDNIYRFPSVPDGVNCDALPINNPPIIFSTAITDAKVGELYTYTVTGHDPDSDVLQYSLTSSVLGMSIDATTGVIDWTPIVDQVGLHTIVVVVTDPGGLTATQSFEITVEPAADVLSATIVANPTSGLSPLTVRFSSDVTNNNIVINSYAWDFTSDGVTDVSDTFGMPRTYTYTGNPGDKFTATLTVTPASGDPLIATKTITIQNESPVVSVAASATNGPAPLAISFTVTGQDPQGMTDVSIDYEGDGTFDATIALNNVTTFTQAFQTTYSTEGNFLAVVKVTDAFGAETVVSNNAINVDVNNPLDPVIVLSASPTSGNAPLTSNLTATATISDGSLITQWQWDLDGDGTFETQGGTATTDVVSFIYNGVDNYYPVVEVVTDSGRSAKASLRIQTLSTGIPSLSIPDSSDTINSDSGGQASINVTLPYETMLELWIENASGGRVSTLQAPQLTSAGSLAFAWDGTNSQGDTVSEGDYYVVLGYTQYGLPRVLDLRGTTGGELSYYRRTTANPRSFDRLKGPLRIDYAVNDPSEVSFFWQISFGAKLMTLMERERLGRGPYSLYWNGEYPSGAKVPPNLNRLMPGIVRYRLPNNVIFVKENPRIENFTLGSTVIVDPRREPILLNLSISKLSTIEVVVSDMDKGVDVATRVFPDTAAGSQTLIWDGKNDANQYLAPSDYRIGVRSVDATGKRSLFWYRTQRIDY